MPETTFEMTIRVTATITPEQVPQKSEEMIEMMVNWGDDIRRVQLVEPPIIQED